MSRYCYAVRSASALAELSELRAVAVGSGGHDIYALPTRLVLRMAMTAACDSSVPYHAMTCDYSKTVAFDLFLLFSDFLGGTC